MTGFRVVEEERTADEVRYRVQRDHDGVVLPVSFRQRDVRELPPRA